MAQSSSELNTIHLRRLATPGRRYFGDDERVYIGTSDGRLKLEDKAKETSFKPTSTISETNVQDAIENLSSGSNIGALLTDTATIDFTYNSVVPASITADLKNTTVTAAVYGSATQSPTITIDAQGRITNAVNTAIAIAPGAIALTTNQILVGGAGNLAFDVAMSGEASIVAAGTVTLLNSAVIGKVLTGYLSGPGVLAATDTILQAFQKLNGNIAALVTGVSSVTGTLNRITTSPTTGAVVVDIAATYVGQSSITTLGTISTGTWNGSVISPVYGGTGIANNVASTLTISGAFATTLTVTGVTGVTLPLSGTLYGTLANSITSAQLASSLTDETGTLLAVFSDSPTFTTQITAPLIIGGTAVGSLITYKSTTGAGTTSAIGHEFTGGTNGATSIARLYNNGSIDIGTAAADIAATNLSISKTITGGTNAYGVYLNSTVQSGVTSVARMYLSAPSTVASVFNVDTFIHFQANSASLGAGSSITGQRGYFCNDLTTATNNYGFWGALSAGSTKWNTYMVGTAQNYFAGNTAIGATSSSVDRFVVHNTTSNIKSFFVNTVTTSTGASTDNGSFFTFDNTPTVDATFTNTVQINSINRGTLNRVSTVRGVIGLWVVHQNNATAGTLTNFSSHNIINLNNSTGTITNNNGIHIQTATNTGGGVVTNNYGVRVDAQTVGSTLNAAFACSNAAATGTYNFYASGTAQNYFAGNVGIGITSPTSVLHLKAGTATANTAPLQFTSGTVETVARAGVMEYNGQFSLVPTDATRRFITLAASSTKTVAGAPYANDGYITLNINGTDIKVMTTA